MAEGQRLETQPAAEIVLPGINAKDKVLVADAEPALPVDSRLVARDHARKDGLTVEVLTDVLRTFVHIEVESYTVAGPVTEIAHRVPQRLPREDIQLTAGSSLWEHRLG